MARPFLSQRMATNTSGAHSSLPGIPMSSTASLMRSGEMARLAHFSVNAKRSPSSRQQLQRSACPSGPLASTTKSSGMRCYRSSSRLELHFPTKLLPGAYAVQLSPSQTERRTSTDSPRRCFPPDIWMVRAERTQTLRVADARTAYPGRPSEIVRWVHRMLLRPRRTMRRSLPMIAGRPGISHLLATPPDQQQRHPQPRGDISSPRLDAPAPVSTISLV